jgi:CDP-paratose synthetase
MKNLLITGVNGFLGSNLAKGLINGYNLVGLESSIENLYRIKGMPIEIYSSSTSLEDIFYKHRIDAIVHTATIFQSDQVGIRQLIQTNLVLPISLMELAQRYNVKSFINTDSFFSNYHNQYDYLSEYTMSKRHVWEWLKSLQKSICLVNMKLFHMYGPDDNPGKFVPGIVSKLMNHEPLIKLTEGSQLRDFIFIDDVVQAFATVLAKEEDSEVYEFEVGTGIGTSIKEFVSRTKSISCSASLLEFGALSYRKNEIMSAIANPNPLYEIGWKPKVDLNEGISKIIDSLTFKEQA